MSDQLPVISLPDGGTIDPMAAVDNEKIESIEKLLLEWPQVECPLTHHFAPGVYTREILMPAGSFIIGHEHKTKHVNIVLSGRALVMINGQPFQIEAPYIFVSDPGVRKVLFILEDMRFATVHPTQETDLVKLEEELIIKSISHQAYNRDLTRLQQLIESQ